jgi:hypothetical protein
LSRHSGVELLPLEFKGRHEVIDGFDLGIGKHRFVEGDSLGDVVIENAMALSTSCLSVVALGAGPARRLGDIHMFIVGSFDPG